MRSSLQKRTIIRLAFIPIAILAAIAFAPGTAMMSNRGLAASPATPAGSGRIAFMRYPENGTAELYTMFADGSGVTRLTNNSVDDYGPVWSPDGTKLAFTREVGGLSQIFVMNDDGSNEVNISNGSYDFSFAAWSPDGTKIAFSSDRSGVATEIYVMNADGSNPSRLTDAHISDLFPAWSPDGTKIAFASFRNGISYEIYVMNADGSNQTPLTNNNDPEITNFSPSWSPDGSLIAFGSNRDGIGNIYVMGADGSNPTRITTAGGGYPTWSPDGTQLAFMSARDGNWEIYAINLDGTGEINLTNDPQHDVSPDWGRNNTAPTPTPTPTPTPDIVPSFVVNSTNDAGDGVCDAAECTLREAVTAANAAAGADAIAFDPAAFAAPGPHTINLSGALPNLSSDMTIQGPGANILTVRRDTGGDYRVFTIDAGQAVTISGLTISNGAALANLFPADSGGGILNLGALTLMNSTVSSNADRNCGGGICNYGTAHVINSRVTVNDSDHSGGGIGNRGTLAVQNSTVSNNTSLFYGGGIFNRWTATACSVTNSTVSGNYTGDSGGGLYSEGPLTLTSSTVSGNRSAGNGGGITYEGGTLEVVSATITNNRADADDSGAGTGGGIFFRFNFVDPLLRNTIVAGNYRGATSTTGDDIDRPSGYSLNASSSFNLIGTGGGGLTDGVNSNQVGVAGPGLGPLQNNGGPTETHALLAGSPAIDKGNNFSLTADQRGSTRPNDDPAVTNASGGDGSDIGAFEQQPGNAMSTVTPAGSNVAVQLGPVGVTFSGVSAPGTTSQVSIDPATAGTLPGGYSLGLGLPAYEITTTAQYTPPVTVCLNLPAVNDPATFDTLRILHGEGGMLVDRTILPPDSPAPDFNSRTICARVTSLSPFVVAQLLTPTRDTTAPTVTISAPLDGATFVKGQAVTAGYSCQDEAGGSGLASCTGTIANGATVDTSTVGSHTFIVTGTDIAGNSATATSTYNVVYGFSGFLQPVENLPALNIANAGSAIPVKFSLGGNQGLAIFAAGYPASSPIPCDASEPGTVIEGTVTASSNSLSYNATTDQYNYVWKTDRPWRGTCRMLVFRFNDGTEHLAKFRFR